MAKEVDQQNRGGLLMTPLHIAVALGQKSVVRSLLEKGAGLSHYANAKSKTLFRMLLQYVLARCVLQYYDAKLPQNFDTTVDQSKFSSLAQDSEFMTKGFRLSSFAISWDEKIARREAIRTRQCAFEPSK
jgi:ankyrin repeat protein